MRRIGGLVLTLVLGAALPALAVGEDVAFKDATERDAKLIDQRVDRVVRVIGPELSLTEAQIERLRPLLTQHYREVTAAAGRHSAAPRDTARQRRLEEIELSRDLLHESLADVMTADQLQQFKELQRRGRNRAFVARDPE